MTPCMSQIFLKIIFNKNNWNQINGFKYFYQIWIILFAINPFFYKQLNSSTYCNVSETIQLNISHLFKQFIDETVQFLTIQFSISHLFIQCLNVKQFYLTHRWDSIRCYHSESGKTGEGWQSRGTQYSPQLQHYWIITIRLFSVIFRTLIVGVCHPPQSVYSTVPADLYVHGWKKIIPLILII